MQTGHRPGRGCLGIGVALVWAAFSSACHSTSPGGSTSSESHFLTACETSCPDGLSCICGVCSLACTLDQGCQSVTPRAVCRATSDASRGPACGGAHSDKACDLGCENDVDCNVLSDAHRCDHGFCRRAATQTASSAPPDAGSMLTDGGAGATVHDPGQVTSGGTGADGPQSGAGGSTQLADAADAGGGRGGPSECSAVDFHLSAGGPAGAPDLCYGFPCGVSDWLTLLDARGEPISIDLGCGTDCSSCEATGACGTQSACGALPMPVPPDGERSTWNGMQWTVTGACPDPGGTACSTQQCVPPGHYTARFCGWVLQADQVGSQVCNLEAARTQKCVDVPFDYPTSGTVEGVIDPTCAIGGESCVASPCCGSALCCEGLVPVGGVKLCYEGPRCPPPVP